MNIKSSKLIKIIISTLIVNMISMKPSYSYAGNQLFGTLDDNIPVSVEFVNGSFEEYEGESFNDSYSYDYIPDSTLIGHRSMQGLSSNVKGWVSLPIYQDDYFNRWAHYIEIQKVGSGSGFPDSSPDGSKHYAELNVECLGMLYQIVNTSPGSRIYYKFYHRGKDGQDTMTFHLTTRGVQPDIDNLIQTCTDGLEWGEYTGVYKVPQGQYKTKFVFKSASGSSTVGNLIDAVSLKTGAFIYPEKMSDKDDTIVSPGDIITYKIKLTNYGELEASRVIVSDILGDDVTYIDGSASADIPDINITYDDEMDMLIADLSNTYIDGVASDNNTATITYKVTVNDWYKNDGTMHTIRNQAHVSYNDKGYEDYDINKDGHENYSNISEIIATKPIATSSIAVQKIWKDNKKTHDAIYVQLYRYDPYGIGDKVAIEEPKELSDDNDWYYEWTIEDDLETKNTDEMTDMIASISDGYVADDDESGYIWQVEEISKLSGYISSIKEVSDRQWQITNIYTRDDSSSGGGSSSNSKNSDNILPEKEKKEDVIVTKSLISGEEKPGSEMTYEIVVSNEGDKDAKGIRIRDYMPEFTTYSSCDELGEYGVISGREHVTWFIDNLSAGESKNLTVTVDVGYCLPGHVVNSAMYEVTGSTDKPYTNDPSDPGNSTPIARDISLSDDNQYRDDILSGIDISGSNVATGNKILSRYRQLPKTGESDDISIVAVSCMSAIITIYSYITTSHRIKENENGRR